MDIETTPINFRRALVAGNIYAALRQHVDASQSGRVLPSGLYYVLWKASAGVKLAQVPDVSFLRPDKLNVFDPTLPYPGAPDFAVECVTVTEADMVTLEKVRDYLAAGSEEVWVVYIGLKEIHRYRRDEPRVIQAFIGDDAIDGGALFPGLQVVTSVLFD
jgi:Uma2 family endonuclease